MRNNSTVLLSASLNSKKSEKAIHVKFKLDFLEILKGLLKKFDCVKLNFSRVVFHYSTQKHVILYQNKDSPL